MSQMYTNPLIFKRFFQSNRFMVSTLLTFSSHSCFFIQRHSHHHRLPCHTNMLCTDCKIYYSRTYAVHTRVKCYTLAFQNKHKLFIIFCQFSYNWNVLNFLIFLQTYFCFSFAHHIYFSNM